MEKYGTTIWDTDDMEKMQFARQITKIKIQAHTHNT